MKAPQALLVWGGTCPELLNPSHKLSLNPAILAFNTCGVNVFAGRRARLLKALWTSIAGLGFRLRDATKMLCRDYEE